MDRDAALALDDADDLALLRDRFVLPEAVIYLDGNSLGPLPRATPARLEEVVRQHWGVDLVRSWTAHDWIDLPETVGRSIAPLVGADPGEVVVADSTSVNLFKLLAAALRLRPDRRRILAERESFPTDLYVAQGLAELVGAEIRVVSRAELGAALDERVAVLLLSQVDFRSGELHDVAAWTAAAHDVGALALWDLAHSAGVLPVELDACAVDLAVGCGYKYLNGGPGAPSFAFVARRLHDELQSPLWGWMGHAEPFALEPLYAPASGVARLGCGTPPILSLVALAAGVDTVADVGIDRLRNKSRRLTELFVDQVERFAGDFGLQLATPRDAHQRGSQVSFRHPAGYALIAALIERGVIGDFRAPDLMRFGFGPAYVRYVDAWDAAEYLRETLASRSWDRADLHRRARVT